MHTASDLVRDALAVSPGGLTQTHLTSLLRRRRADLDGRPANGETLAALVSGMDDVEQDGRFYLVDREPVIRRLWREGRLLEVLEDVGRLEPYETTKRPGWWSKSPDHVAQRALIEAMVAKDDARLRSILDAHGFRALEDLMTVFLDPFEPEMVGALTAVAQNHCVLHAALYVEHLQESDLRAVDAFVRGKTGKVSSAVRALVDFLRGRLDEARRRLGAHAEDDASSVLGAICLFAGDVNGACSHYRTWLASRRKLYGKDFVPETTAGAYLPVAYLLSGKKGLEKQALNLIDRAESFGAVRPDRLLGGWDHLRCLVDPSHQAEPVTHPVGAAFEALVRVWRGEPREDARFSVREQSLRDVGLDLLADEIAAWDQGQVARLREVRPAWRDALDRLASALGQGATEAGPPAADSRLAWILTVYGDHPDLEPRLQLLRSGRWTSGRKVALERVYQADDASLPWTDADRALVEGLRQVQRRNYAGYTEVSYSWSTEPTWRALASHPAVFDQHFEPVRVELRAPALEVVPGRGGGRAVRLSASSSAVERLGRTWQVTLLTDKQRAVAEILGSGMVFPPAAAEELDALVESASALFPTVGADQPIEEADARVHLFLRPASAGIEVELGVLPAGPEGPRLPPAMGSPIVLGAVDGVGTRFRRDLALEKAFLKSLRELPGLAGVAASDVVPLGLDEALELLGEARAREVPVLWPEGGQVRIRRVGGSSKVRLGAVRGWFEASGTLTTDDGLAVDLAELARRIMASSTRFIALDDGSYLELEDTLRAGLDVLSRVGEVQEERIRVHPLATSVFADLLTQPGFKATAGVKAKVEAAARGGGTEEPPRGLRAELRPYQLDAYRWLVGLAELGAGGILADDMGLGKTITALAMLVRQSRHGPSLVVAPTSVVGNWVREAERFAPGLRLVRLRELDSLDPDTLGPGDVIVCTYSLLVHRLDQLVGIEWAVAVFDESQALKNPQTQRHQAAVRIQGQLRLALTGTPIENHLGELHAQLSVVLPGLLGSERQFQERFARPVEAGDATVRRSLKALVQPFLLRRTKASVLDDLPPRTDKDLLIELGSAEAALYEAERERALDALGEGANAMAVLAHLTRLRQLACSPALVLDGYSGESAKTRAFRRLSRDLHDGGHAVLVFSQFVKHLTLLRDVLDGEGIAYAYLDGSTPASRREELVRQFQAGDVPFFLISLKAGGTGLNLTAAEYVLHLDPWWNPAVEDQASDRAHRIGQQRAVTVYRLIAQGTVEEQIVELHRTKRELASQILEGTESVKRLSAEDLLRILRRG